MTDTTVTPELLLFLAGKMGVAVEMRGPFVCLAHGGRGYAPHTDPAQFGRMVVWAAMNGLEPMLAKRHTFAGLVGTSSDYTQAHDSTEAGIMAATVVAIARAAGYEGPTHER